MLSAVLDGINCISCYDPRFWKARIRGLVEDRIHSGGSHCVLVLYLIPFEKDASDSLISYIHNWGKKKNQIPRMAIGVGCIG